MDYDYIIAGAGCAGLSLAMHLVNNDALKHKSILLIDKDPKKSNDRTWCFWEKEAGIFEPVVYRQWASLQFASRYYSDLLSFAPYRYKMIRGIDFYGYCRSQLGRFSNVHFLEEEVVSLEGSGVRTASGSITAQYVFNSILFQKPELKTDEYWLLQHFKGWRIRTDAPVFDEQKATLMDFRIDQSQGTAFCYVLPSSSTEALVEYTLFSEKLLAPQAYDEGLKQYISKLLKIEQYSVEEEEFGIIPMTNYRFDRGKGSIVSIGTAGGQTKASSGYTFRNIQKHSSSIVAALAAGKDPHVQGDHRRFLFYDSVLLRILREGRPGGDFIFSQLFRKNAAPKVLAFLDNETTLLDELSIIRTLPTIPFSRAALSHLVS